VLQQLAMLDELEARLAEVCKITGQTAEEALADIRSKQAHYLDALQLCEIQN
jgi:hypothetical protein